MFATDRPLDVQREEFKRARLIAMPIAGLIVWLIIGILGMFLPTGQAALGAFHRHGLDRLSGDVHLALHR